MGGDPLSVTSYSKPLVWDFINTAPDSRRLPRLLESRFPPPPAPPAEGGELKPSPLAGEGRERGNSTHGKNFKSTSMFNVRPYLRNAVFGSKDSREQKLCWFDRRLAGLCRPAVGHVRGRAYNSIDSLRPFGERSLRKGSSRLGPAERAPSDSAGPSSNQAGRRRSLGRCNFGHTFGRRRSTPLPSRSPEG
jgi:hypothetical protein